MGPVQMARREHRRRRQCLLLGCLLVSWLGCGGGGPAGGSGESPPPTPSPSADVPDTLKYGVHSVLEYGSPYGLSNHVAKLQEIGAQVSRNDFLWHQIEATQGVFAWGTSDSVVDSLLGAGIEPLMVIWGSPAWANGSSDPSVVPTSDPQLSFWLDHYRAFIRALATRYKGRVNHWELWNEPNILDFWKPPSIDVYARWASAVESEIRAIDPNARVAYGSLTNLEVAWDEISGEEFLRGLYARGISPRIVSVHPYAYGNEPPEEGGPGDGKDTFRDVVTMRQVMLENGGESGVIWITEYGWWAGPSYFNPSVSLTEGQQADYLGRSLALVRSWPYVTRVIWCLDWDRPGVPYNGVGLVRLDGTLRPAALTFRSAPR